MNRTGRPWVVVAAALVGGAATSLAFAPAVLGVFAVAGPAIGLWAFVHARGVRAAAMAGLLHGLAFTFLTFHWMYELDVIAYVVLCLLQALFWVLVAALARALPQSASGSWVVGVAAAWTLVEFARARFPVSGFEWGQLGLTAAGTTLRRAAAIVGGVGLPGLIVAVAAAVPVVVVHRTVRSALPLGLAVLALATATALGTVSWTAPVAGMQVALVQADPPCPGEFAEDCPGFRDVLLDSYLARTGALSSTPDLVVWGEDALPGGADLDAVGEQFAARAGTPPAPLLAGTGTPAAPGRFLRWAALFDTDGTALGGYAKRRPVPFGEYVPLRSLLGGISDVGRLVPTDMMPGEDTSPVMVPVGGRVVPLGTVVSWEVSFSRLVRDVAHEAQGLVTLTTVSSYGTTAASDQLLATAQLRAAEHQKAMAVAATTGRSAMIEPDGRIAASTALLRADDTTAAMPLRSGMTPFARAGELPVAAVAALALVAAVAWARRRAAAESSEEGAGSAAPVEAAAARDPEVDTPSTR